MNEDNQDRPQFNMAVAFLQRIDELWKQADQAKNEGNNSKWYRVLDTIYCDIRFKIDEAGHEAEEKALEASFEACRKHLSSDRTTNQGLNRQIDAIVINTTERLLRDVHIKLHTLLFKYNMIFPLHEQKQPSQAIKGMFVRK